MIIKNKKSTIYIYIAIAAAALVIITALLLVIKFKPFSGVQTPSKAVMQTFKTDFDYNQFQKKFMNFDYVENCDFKNPKDSSKTLIYCLNILYQNKQIGLDKKGTFPLSYDDDKIFVNVLSDYFGVKESVQNFLPCSTYIAGKMTFRENLQKPLSKTLNYQIIDIKKTSDSNHFYTVSCQARDRETGILVNNTVFTVRYDKKSMSLNNVKVNPVSQFIIQPLKQASNVTFSYYKPLVIQNHKLFFRDGEHLTLIDADTLKTVATAKVDLNGQNPEYYIQKCKIGENNIIVITNDKVYVFDYNLNRVKVIKIPKAIQNDFYDISSDLATFCYHLNNGIYYSDLNLQNQHLVVKDESPISKVSNQKEKYYMVDGFADHNSKIVVNAFDFNGRYQTCVYDIKTQAFKRFGTRYDDHTIYSSNDGRQYFIKKNNTFDMLDFKNMAMTTDCSADIPIEVGNISYNMSPIINENDLYYITQKGFVYYLNTYNTQTKKSVSRPLSVGFMPEIQSVLPDGRIIISYQSNDCYNYNVISSDDMATSKKGSIVIK